MKIEVNEEAGWSITVIAIVAAFIVLVTQIGSCGRQSEKTSTSFPQIALMVRRGNSMGRARTLASSILDMIFISVR